MTDSIKLYFDKKPILITGHINPDGDALGAAFCLKILLNNLLQWFVFVFSDRNNVMMTCQTSFYGSIRISSPS